MADKKLFVSVLIAALLALAIGGGFLSLYLQQQELHSQIASMRSKLSTQADEQATKLQKIGLNQQIFFRNLNESRNALQLPSTQYIPISEDEISAAESGQETAEGVAGDFGEEDFFRAVQYMDNFYRRQELSYKLSDLFGSDQYQDFLQANDLSNRKVKETGYRIIPDSSEFQLVRMEGAYDNEEAVLSLTSFSQEELSLNLNESHTQLVTQVRRFVYRAQEDLDEKLSSVQARREKVEDLLESSPVQNLLQDKNCTVEWESREQAHQDFVFSVHGPERHAADDSIDGSERLLRAGVRFPAESFFLDMQSYSEYEAFRNALLDRLKALDPRSEEEKQVDAAIEQVRKIAQEAAFEAFLDQRDLRLRSVPREDGDYFYFDLYSSDGAHYGAFAVLKKYGELYLTDPDDLIISSLKTAATGPKIHIQESDTSAAASSSDSQKYEALPDPSMISRAGSSNESVLLLCGTHEKNADTIMLARLSEGDKIRLLSIPRDIYYRNRKLSSHYRTYGMQRLQQVVGEITGLQIDAYLSIDMYAFIDVIDVLQGIDIHLQEALVDPTYKVRENGEWSTLYYPAGTHHLNGIEALRVARSRHTSDDFDRSYRQQLVLKSLMQRLNELHAGKLKEVYDIFQVLHRYIDTDLSVYELGQYFLAYHDANIDLRKSLSTDNVLYTTYSNYYLSGISPEEADADFYKGAWILLPEENQWDRIRSFVYQALYTENELSGDE